MSPPRADAVRLLSHALSVAALVGVQGGGAALLGGDDQLSTLEHAAVNNAALTVAMVHDAGVRWLQGEAIDPGGVATLVNAFNRTAAILGWQRRAKDVSADVYEIAAAKAKERAE